MRGGVHAWRCLHVPVHGHVWSLVDVASTRSLRAVLLAADGSHADNVFRGLSFLSLSLSLSWLLCRDMAQWFGTSNGKLYNDVLKLFHEMRGQGLRLHYWP